MRVTPVSARALALLHDDVDGRPRRSQVGHRKELLETLIRGGRLCLCGTDEEAGLPHPLHQPCDPLLDRPIQVPNRLEVLHVGPDLIGLVMRQLASLCHGGEAPGIGHIHAFGAFEECEMAKGFLAERQQRHLHPGRHGVRGQRPVRPRQSRRGTHRRQQVLDDREVQHLLLPDVDQLPAPAQDLRQQLLRHTLGSGLLER